MSARLGVDSCDCNHSSTCRYIFKLFVTASYFALCNPRTVIYQHPSSLYFAFTLFIFSSGIDRKQHLPSANDSQAIYSRNSLLIPSLIDFYRSCTCVYASRTLKCVKDKLLSVYTEPSVAIMFTSNIQQRPEDKHTTPRETHDLEMSDKTGCMR